MYSTCKIFLPTEIGVCVKKKKKKKQAVKSFKKQIDGIDSNKSKIEHFLLKIRTDSL